MTTRDEVISISNRIADEGGIPRLLLLACGIAESNLRPEARRPVNPAQDASYWPDVSPGVWQQAVRWANEYLDWAAAHGHTPAQFPGADVVSAVMAHYWNVEHAARVAAAQLKGKYKPDEANAIERALARYNWPAGGGTFASEAHAANYRRGIREAEQILASLGAGGTDETGPTTVTKYVFPVQGYSGPVNLHWGQADGIGGTDIFAPKGTPVVAIADGTVVYRVAGSPLGGNAVQIEHDSDGLESYYAHGDRAPLVQMGQHVNAGTMFFGVGDTGNAAGKGHHLHFGMGKEIQTGSGVQSGLGTEFDAVALLRSMLTQPKPGVPDDVAALKAEVARLQAQVDGMVNALAYIGDDQGDKLAAVLGELRRVREQYVGKRPAA